MLKISPTCWTKTDTCALLFLENYTAGSKRPQVFVCINTEHGKQYMIYKGNIMFVNFKAKGFSLFVEHYALFYIWVPCEINCKKKICIVSFKL